ncbi:MAG: 16S rRNA (guanine(527)-N(7))-methyltransferase RsmG [Cyanothece sp. SIO1E1]|nr:16S rRNA (guanine(527)-N(7))-methyltransferase RsmG [Cyanothece sp. SIO1E1]
MGDLETQTLPDLIELCQQTLHWQPNATQTSQFQQLYQQVLAANRQFNLTRITEPIEFWEKHLWDSLRGVAPLWPEFRKWEAKGGAGEIKAPVETLQATSENAAQGRSDYHHNPIAYRPLPVAPKVIDIGTGAGFPGIPIAIAQPDWSLTLLDATRKKITFLDRLLPQLAIEHATPLIGRVEQIAHMPQHREAYDLALIRAVGSAATCAEYALPLVKVGGWAILYRGQWTLAEAKVLHSAVAQLGGQIEAVEAFTTPLSQSKRHCIFLRKVEVTAAKFPRAVGLPAKLPLAND